MCISLGLVAWDVAGDSGKEFIVPLAIASRKLRSCHAGGGK